MEERKLTEKESLEVITSMIALTRHSGCRLYSHPDNGPQAAKAQRSHDLLRPCHFPPMEPGRDIGNRIDHSMYRHSILRRPPMLERHARVYADSHTFRRNRPRAAYQGEKPCRRGRYGACSRYCHRMLCRRRNHSLCRLVYASVHTCLRGDDDSAGSYSQP